MPPDGSWSGRGKRTGFNGVVNVDDLLEQLSFPMAYQDNPLLSDTTGRFDTRSCCRRVNVSSRRGSLLPHSTQVVFPPPHLHLREMGCPGQPLGDLHCWH